MYQIDTRSALDLYYDDLVYLEATLLATEETRAFAASVTAQLGRCAEIRATDLDTRRVGVQTQAGCAIGDMRLDAVIDAVSNAALYASDMDRGARLYATLFPTAPSRMTRYSLARQVGAAKDIEGRMSLSVVPEALRAEQAPPLTAAIANAEALLERRSGAAHRRAEARLQIADFKDDTNALRLQVYSQLVALAASDRLPRAWAEAFFRPRRRDEVQAQAPAEPEEGTPAA